MKEKEIASKEKYETPQVRLIKITPDELASVGCKSIMVAPLVCNNNGIFINRQQGS